MNRRAFSIVEIMVVISVIGLLVGIAIPALSSVSAAGRSSRCQHNLRQMAVAAQTYAATYDAYPVGIRYEKINGVLHHLSWDWVTKGANQIVSPGALWAFANNPGEVLQCPDYHGPPNAGEEFTGYNYNTTYIGGESPFMQLGWKPVRPRVPPHACSRSSQCAMFGDGGRKGGASRYMRAPMRSEGPLVPLSAIYNGGQAFRHSHATNIAYIDGHIGAADRPCEGKLATGALLDQMGFPSNGFLSDDDHAYDPR